MDLAWVGEEALMESTQALISRFLSTFLRGMEIKPEGTAGGLCAVAVKMEEFETEAVIAMLSPGYASETITFCCVMITASANTNPTESRQSVYIYTRKGE